MFGDYKVDIGFLCIVAVPVSRPCVLLEIFVGYYFQIVLLYKLLDVTVVRSLYSKVRISVTVDVQTNFRKFNLQKSNGVDEVINCSLSFFLSRD